MLSPSRCESVRIGAIRCESVGGGMRWCEVGLSGKCWCGACLIRLFRPLSVRSMRRQCEAVRVWCEDSPLREGEMRKLIYA